MENTLESALLFFGAHLNSEAGCRAAVFHPSYYARNNEGKFIMSASILADIHEGTFSYKDFYLKRKPLSSITDEDAIEVAKICSFHDGQGMLIYHQNDRVSMYDKHEDEPHKKNVLHLFHESFELFSLDEEGRVFQYDMERLLNVCDYLRSRGYALPYNGVSVEEQTNRGWTKLKTE